jgi:hypothetical protein
VKRLALIFTLAILTSLMIVPATFARADTTDLNIIPVTDTLKEGTFEWDVWARYSEDVPRGRRIGTRLFGSLFQNFEFGMSWGISRKAGPVELALKYKVLDEYEGGFPVSLAVGAEGITGNYETTGMDPTFYGVVGVHDVHLGGWWDWFVGYAHNPTGYDTEDGSVFGGFKFWINDDLAVNADYWGRNSNEDYTIAGGLNYDWINHMGFQGWVERDSVTEDNVFVLQFVARADMRDLTEEVSDPE